MNVIVDTPVWSSALRRRPAGDRALVGALRSLIVDHRAILLGPIRQEVLSGIREQAQFDRLRSHLDAFPDLGVRQSDYVAAAECFNTCRAHGIQGSNTDFLICSVSINHGLAVFTTDRDFARYAQHLPFHLHAWRG